MFLKALKGAWPIQRWSASIGTFYEYCTILSTIAYMQVIHLLHCREWLEVKYLLDLNECFGTMFLHEVISSLWNHNRLFRNIYFTFSVVSKQDKFMMYTSNILDLLYVTLQTTLLIFGHLAYPCTMLFPLTIIFY